MTMSKGRIARWSLGLAIACCAAAAGGAAFAQTGQPAPWEVSLQQPASPVMENIVWFHSFMLWLITLITLFVLALLVIVVVKFNAKANPVPSKTTHNTLIEVAWTIVPVLILVAVAVPSFRLLFLELDIPKPDLTVKATGNQWNWTYTYPDDKIEFTSIMLTDEERAKMNPVPPRLLGVDNEMVVPVDKVVRIQTTAADVIHSWAIPSFGVKIDAVPGRLNEAWFKATKEGRYYGQCSELCGRDHAFMPIVVHVVNEQEYEAWKKKQQVASRMRDDSYASAASATR
ncbi:cytochrome c oxidase subunit 2 [Rhodopseudomonas thermotolerans]|jgi:cytochrome c oxidase subunit 2|uniref:Cytochrome c oxidase subunit 2 n=2 Tax=Rhodopseudomonas TaxID=1073 RepID=A0A336JSU2_9BRAD|nr:MULTISPECIES: cytochrome c oxidase subunit II [Rhodopseudomonas]RED27710.1 cytochrome c oxidase subunit 2 [Rhodopseudomonas pentothenatexigens]REF91245.1 cytochrome c oxidase subunit 2 [Rhodopseudomonas thermotolerans]SSW92855.1 cytochrome c oxidase subunit 2 [Rhodopseudomonas pentothenatexigens]